MKLNSIFFYIVLSILIMPFQSNINGYDKNGINIDEQLGKYIPLNVKFVNSMGKEIVLKDLFNDKPVVFAFVYYKCPGICTPLMTELAEVINKSTLEPGIDYRVVVLSMDERETPKIAAAKKKEILNLIDKKIAPDSWEFLTGSYNNIKKIADATGFHFKREGTQFIHTTSVMFLTRDGKLSRYLYPRYRKSSGFSILPFSFKLAVIDATKGNIIPSVGKLLAFCFSYDPQGRTYVFDILKVAGASTILTVGLVILILVRKKKST
ncbi:MAG TPA: SCO family protein [Ignavibacteria bacterium]|nr:SCO family protein [Ignavibacteria bacterium]